MAYDHQKQDVQISPSAQVLTATGVIGRLYPGQIPVIVRSVGIVISTVPTVTATVVSFKRRPTAGSTSGEVVVTTLTLPTTGAQGQVYYKTNLSTKLSPGEELVADVTTASTAGAGTVMITTEPTWELPANNTKMIVSA